GRRHALTGDISKDEMKISCAVFRMDHVAVITAHRPGGLIVVMDLPAGHAQVGWRKQGPLDLRRQFEVALECALLCFREMVEAVADKWVGDHSSRCDRC